MTANKEQGRLFQYRPFKIRFKRQGYARCWRHYICQRLSFFVHFFSTVILARLLTPNDFGLITMVTAFSLLLQNFGVNGFTEAIIQREDLNHKMMSTLFWLNAAISSALTIIFMLMAPFLVWFYKEPQLNTITIGIAFSIIAGGMSTLHMAILRRNMQFYITPGFQSNGAYKYFTAILLAWLGWGYWALVANTVMHPLTVAFMRLDFLPLAAR